MMKFRQIEHTADLGLEIFGRTIQELFINAYQGFYTLVLGNLSSINEFTESSSTTQKFEIKEASCEDLLVTFLSELNFNLQVRRLMLFPLKDLKLKKKDKQHLLKLETGALKLNQKLLENLTEIKAVTYHDLHIIQKDGMYSVTIIFDI